MTKNSLINHSLNLAFNYLPNILIINKTKNINSIWLIMLEFFVPIRKCILYAYKYTFAHILY